MLLEDYFEFRAPDDIRLKGRRLGIQHLLSHYLQGQMTPAEIAEQYEEVTQEQVHAVILYYLANKEKVTRYMENWVQGSRQAREEARKKDPAFYERWRQLKEERQAAKTEGSA